MFDSEAWQRCVAFHGHECPGLAIGFRAALAALDILEAGFSSDEQLVCVTENDACGVDAVQVLTGCSIGKGNLIYRDTGKMAFSFFRRSDDRSVRVLFTRHFDRNTVDRAAMQQEILTAGVDDIFSFGAPSYSPPARARIFASIVCENCGEAAPEHKIRIHQGKKVCLDCCPDYSRGW